jgi:hypothetical protein
MKSLLLGFKNDSRISIHQILLVILDNSLIFSIADLIENPYFRKLLIK